MLARSSFILLLLATVAQAMFGTCRTSHALSHAAHADVPAHCHEARDCDHHHPAAAQPIDHCNLCGDHDPAAPSHTHVCRAESTPARLRTGLDLPSCAPLLLAVLPDLPGAGPLPQGVIGASRAGRTSTGPPPSIRTTRLLI